MLIFLVHLQAHKNQYIFDNMEDYEQVEKDFFQLARLAAAGKTQDVQLLLRRLANRYQGKMPELAKQLTNLVREAPGSKSVLRGVLVEDIPVDLDSRLQLARTEYPVVLDVEPIWASHVKEQVEQIVLEQVEEAALQKADLRPTKSALFTGPPGVGKTLAARWLASKLDRPLIVLDGKNGQQCAQCHRLRKRGSLRFPFGRIRCYCQAAG
jgi:SpoVK/Ycf46/Vps4 family AAA+-type ATPase